MGPLTIIDKSMVQALSLEEIRTMSMHYSIVVCPMLIQEMCANLIESGQENDDTRSKVSYLAGKARNAGHFAVTNFGRIAAHDLMGGSIPMDGRIPRFDGKEVVDSQGSRGIYFDESDEDKLMRRWESGVFNDEDRKTAEDHTTYLKNYDLDQSRKDMAAEFPENAKYKSLTEVIEAVDKTNDFHDQFATIRVAAMNFGITTEGVEEIEKRWKAQGSPPFKTYAPYAFYCHRLAAIFFLAVTAGQVTTSKKAKSIVDFQYLYYLPFANLLCSADNFHRDFAPYFLRQDQEFVWAPDLKQDLRNIKACKEKMNDDEKKYYRINFGSYPPPMPDSLTNQIWQRHMRPWKERSGNLAEETSKEEEAAILERLRSIRLDLERKKDS